MVKKDIETLADHTTINRIIREIKQLYTFEVPEQICMSNKKVNNILTSEKTGCYMCRQSVKFDSAD